VVIKVKSIERVKKLVEECVGQKIKFKLKKGKKAAVITEGVITDVYPSVFTVQFESKGLKRIVSFNYIDIVTNNVEFFKCDENETKIV